MNIRRVDIKIRIHVFVAVDQWQWTVTEFRSSRT